MIIVPTMKGTCYIIKTQKALQPANKRIEIDDNQNKVKIEQFF